MADSAPTPLPVLLLVEDNAEQRLMLREFFADFLACDLREAAEGNAAMALALDCPPDLVLLDLHIPPHGGLSLLQTMRDDPRLANVPVIVVSGSRLPSERAAVLAAGAYCFVEKPYDLDLLESRVLGALGGEAPPEQP